MSTPGSLMSIEPWKLGNSQSYRKQTESHNNISDHNNNNDNQVKLFPSQLINAILVIA